jgi:CheY-like chemotaxis protein
MLTTSSAIKFTNSEGFDRTIKVTIGASVEPPRNTEGVAYFPSRMKHSDLTLQEEWGEGDFLYLAFGVEDNGRGLSESEKKLLFQRFSQVNPRTHVQYGGSGLGLFISRELTELQGGEIGVLSEAGKGSLFHFYVKVRKSVAPPGSKPVTAMEISSQGEFRRTSKTIQTTGPSSVLIVEDNLVNAKILRKQLENVGYSIISANHGGEALDRLQESSFWKNAPSESKHISLILMVYSSSFSVNGCCIS